MTSYTGGMDFDLEDFVPFDAEANGAITVSNDLQAMVRIDYEAEGVVGGIFRQVQGTAEINWPATEHAFVLDGTVSITYHSTGDTIEYSRGDGWIIAKGERVTWDVTSPHFAKSFFNRP